MERIEELKRAFREKRSGLIVPITFVGSLSELTVAEMQQKETMTSNVPSLDLRRYTDREVNRVTRMYHDLWLSLIVSRNSPSIEREKAERDYLYRFFLQELAYVPPTGDEDPSKLALKVYDRLDTVNQVMAKRLINE
jgi:hypothetical protein